MHLFHIPQCSIQNINVHISVLNGALWDMEQEHSGICEISHYDMDIFHKTLTTDITYFITKEDGDMGYVSWQLRTLNCLFSTITIVMLYAIMLHWRVLSKILAVLSWNFVMVQNVSSNKFLSKQVFCWSPGTWFNIPQDILSDDQSDLVQSQSERLVVLLIKLFRNLKRRLTHVASFTQYMAKWHASKLCHHWFRWWLITCNFF